MCRKQETFCTLMCVLSIYRSVNIVVVMVTGYSTKIYSVSGMLYYCKSSGLSFSFTVRTRNDTSYYTDYFDN